jgi:hypothetical protein
MRQLTAKQKKLLNAFLNKCINEGGIQNHNLYYDNLPNQLRIDLEKINDTEILWNETERYLNDEITKYKFGKKGIN